MTKDGLAVVVGVDQKSHSVDLVMMDTGQRLSKVRIAGHSASSNTGFFDLTVPDVKGDKWQSGGNSGTRDVIACVQFFNGCPLVMGFVHPRNSQMRLEDANRLMSRHASDVYHTIDANGNAEFFHPSGSFIRFADNIEHEDFTGKDLNQSWKIEKNTDKLPHLYMQVGGNGEAATSVHLDPSGLLEITGTNLVINAPTVTLKGSLFATGDVVAGAVSLLNHVHLGVTPGPGVSGIPVGGGAGGGSGFEWPDADTVGAELLGVYNDA